MKQVITYKNTSRPLPEPIIIPSDKYIHQNYSGLASYTNSGHIDLNYIPTRQTSVEIDFCWLDTSASQSGDNYVFGCNDGGTLYSPNNAYGMRVRTNTAPTFYAEPSYQSSFRDQPRNASWDYNEVKKKHTAFFSAERNHFRFYFDGIDTGIDWTINSEANWARSLWIFAVNPYQGDQYSSKEFAVSEIRIYESDELVRQYKACETTFPNTGIATGALKDEISGNYYYPTFLVNDNDYPYMEYIEIEK